MELDIKKELQELGVEIDKKLDTFNANSKTMSDDVKAELKGEVKELVDKFNKLQSQYDAMDVKMQKNLFVPKATNVKDAIKEAFVKEGLSLDKFLSTGARGKRKIQFNFDGLQMLGKTNVDTDNATGVVVPDRLATGIIYAPDRKVHVRDLLPVGQTSSNSLTFPYEYSIDDKTDLISESAPKPQSAFVLAIKTWLVRKIATYVKVSEEMLDDIPALSSYLTARFSAKLLAKEDTELLYSAVSNATGLTVEATAYSDTLADSNVNRFDILRMACQQLTKDEYSPTAIMMHPTDIAKMDLTKTTTGVYVLPWVFGGTRAIAGVPIIENSAITAGDFLVGDFRQGAQVFDRRQPSVMVYDQNEDDAINNLLTFVFEERVALVVYRGASFIYGDFASALAKGSA